MVLIFKHTKGMFIQATEKKKKTLCFFVFFVCVCVCVCVSGCVGGGDGGRSV